LGQSLGPAAVAYAQEDELNTTIHGPVSADARSLVASESRDAVTWSVERCWPALDESALARRRSAASCARGGEGNQFGGSARCFGIHPPRIQSMWWVEDFPLLSALKE